LGWILSASRFGFSHFVNRREWDDGAAIIGIYCSALILK